MKRNIIWHELFERFDVESCPICELMSDRIRKSMDSFLYEAVNDSVLRDKIKRSGGFCSCHAHMLADMGDPLAHALIYGDLIRDAVDNIEKAVPKVENISRNKTGCFFCEMMREGEKSYIGTFVDAYHDSMFRNGYIAGRSCLCLPHFEHICKMKKGKLEILPDITEDTIMKYRELISDLAEIKRRNDYRYMHEPWTERQKEAWKKAVIMINSKKEIG